MKVLLWGLGGFGVCLAIVVLALACFARLKALPEDRLNATPGPDEVGVHVLQGGIKQVLSLEELPPNGKAQLLQIIQGTSRTTEIPLGPDGKGHTFVTRSALFGFPDIIRVWQAEERLHIHAHLVMGKSDLGVNRKRVEDWLLRLRASTRQ